MVNRLTPGERAQIDTAVAEVEKTSPAKIQVRILPASHHYQEFILLGGLLAGSVASFSLWLSGTVRDYPLLFIVQILVMVTVVLVPFLRRLCVCLVPLRIRRRRAAQRAFAEFYERYAHLPAGQPFVLFFVSLAERYAHVLTNPEVHKKIPDHWDRVIDSFTVHLRKKGLVSTTLQAVSDIGQTLAGLPTKDKTPT